MEKLSGEKLSAYRAKDEEGEDGQYHIVDQGHL